MKIQKPRIRLSTLSRSYVCSGLGATGSGWSYREAWEAWKSEMILKGKRDRIPY